MSFTVDTTSSVYIERSPSSVYDFVTRPRNWVGTHPVTLAVRYEGDDAPAGVGAAFIETIGSDEEPGFDVRWCVHDARPGRLWVIGTDELGDAGVSCRIRYSFESQNTGTSFSRHMTVQYPGDADTGDRYRVGPDGAADPGVHDAYIETVKARLERTDRG